MRRLIYKLFRRKRLEKDLETELAFHEEMSRASGNDIGLGNRAWVKEQTRDVWRWRFVEDIWRDLGHALRRLAKAPAFSGAAILALALAIGANTAIFTLVDGIILNPLPYPDSDRIVDLEHAGPGLNLPCCLRMTLGLYFHYRDRIRTLTDIAVYTEREMTLTGSGEPLRMRAIASSGELESVLQVAPVRGRWFGEADDRAGAPLVAVLSHRLWTDRFGEAADILGKAIVLDGIPAQVVGVMPSTFAFPNPQVDLWVPLRSERTMDFDAFGFQGAARLETGRSATDARAEIDTLIGALPTDYPEINGAAGLADRVGLVSIARPLKDSVIGDIRQTLLILFGSVVFVLLVACANVANLFLVRSEARRHELSVRRALGAGTAAVLRYFFAEAALVAGVGAVTGIAIASVVVRLLRGYGPVNLPRLQEIHLDGSVIVFATVLAAVIAIALSAFPFVGALTSKASLDGRSRSGAARMGRYWVRHTLMGGQVALALMLFVAAGLMVRTFQNLRAIDPGFDPATLTFTIGLPGDRYPDTRAAVRFHREVLDRLEALPGVSSASASTRVPLADMGRGFQSAIAVEGRTVAEGTVPRIVAFRAVAGGFSDAMGTSVVRGRGVERRDVDSGELVAVVNEALVAAYFPDEDPLGQRVKRGSSETPSDWLTIVGVVANTPIDILPEATAAAADPELYLPMSVSGPGASVNGATNGPPVGAMSYVVLTTVPSLTLMPSVRRAVNAVDPSLAVARVATLDDLIDRASAGTAFTMVLLAVAAGVALSLGVVGIYGIVAYIVSQRRSEIGVRLALGADPGQVTAMIVRQGMVVTIAGILVGLAAALAGSRLIEALLYDTSPRDPATFGVTALTLLGIVVLTCWLPARRAARISPTEALRSD